MSQVDNRQNTALSMRTPRARVKGIGAAGHGAEHFWLQRLTGAANALLMLAFVVIIAKMAGRPYPEAVALVAHPLVAIILILAVVSVTLHMRIGMQVIIEDYIHDEVPKFALLIGNWLYSWAVGLTTVFAILKIAFGA